MPLVTLYHIAPHGEIEAIRFSGFRERVHRWPREDGSASAPYRGVVLYSTPFRGGRPLRAGSLPAGYSVLAVEVDPTAAFLNRHAHLLDPAAVGPPRQA